RVWWHAASPYRLERASPKPGSWTHPNTAQLNLWRSAAARLAAVGRMAFSNYIFTSVVCSIFFDGFRFFCKLQRYQLYGVVLFVWVIILVVSPIWLRHFRFGPLEWLWRSLTYWKKQPFRIRAQVAA